MTLPTKVYEALRWIIWIVMPAVGVLFSTLAVTWNWNVPIDAVLTTLSAVELFLGAVLGISKVTNDSKNDTTTEKTA